LSAGQVSFAGALDIDAATSHLKVNECSGRRKMVAAFRIGNA